MRDVRLTPTEVAHKAAKFAPSPMAFYASGMFPGSLSVVALDPESGRVMAGTRLTLEQVIALHEGLENFIEEHATKPSECGTDETHERGSN